MACALCRVSLGRGYIEGGPWQHSFHVPHDVPGLASLFGGEAGLVRKLDAMLATPPRFEVGHYGFEIHEMTEMALFRFRSIRPLEPASPCLSVSLRHPRQPE